jgi:serine/threonine protein kinase
MELHESALGAAPAQAKVATAKEELATARKALRENSAHLRSEVVHLVSLASQHFPELSRHEDVQKFMGSDGLDGADNRRLADYDDVQPLVNGRNELLHASYDGLDVCLKAFPIQGDMRAYQRELLRVQRLQHPYIIRYTAAFQDGNSVYLQMAYFKHGSLRHWIDSVKPDLAQKRSVLRQILLGLACKYNQPISRGL